MIGQRLGHHVLTDFLGEGGMGRVYRARDERLPRHVAITIRTLRPSMTSTRRMASTIS